MEEKLKEVFYNIKKPITIEKLYERVGVVSKEEKEEINLLVGQALINYSIVEANNKYIPITKTSLRKGTFLGSRNGDGKVVVRSSYFNRMGEHIVKEDYYFVDKDGVNGAIDGDVVLIDSFVRDKKGTLGGKVNKVIQRDLNNIYGEVVKEGNSYFVVPVDKKRQGLIIAVEGEAIEGQRVEVKLNKQTSDNFYIGSISRSFDHKDDPSEDILWEAFKLGIDDRFSDEAMVDVNNLPVKVLDTDKIGRMDLTDWEIFTIDGKKTKDIDDAVSCKRLSNGNFLLGVHIADVSNYVLEDSALDKEAFKRGTSNYLTDKVIPMFPHRLSNGICSLNPNVERLAISCIMEIDDKGNVIRHDISPTIIKSQKKMNYDDVDTILTKNIEVDGYEEYINTLQDMRVLADILYKRREEEGSIEFNKPELEVGLGDDGVINEFNVRYSTVATNLIEEFMLVANRTVASDFYLKEIPFIYRVHGKPNEERLTNFIRLLNVIGYEYKKHSASDCCSDNKSMQSLSKYLEKTGDCYNMFSTNVVKCMDKAKYSLDNYGHYGLAFPCYCHFTSPIRRYPDLIVHREIKDFVLNTDDYEKKKREWEEKLPVIAKQTSDREKIADEAERVILRMKCAEYMSKHVGEEFEGTIIGISDSGLQIELDNLIEGRVKVRNLDGEYVYSPDIYTLVSLDDDRDNDNYYVGDRLAVEVLSADKDRKTVDFKVKEKLKENKLRDLDEEVNYVKVKKKDDNYYNSKYLRRANSRN